MEFLEAQVTDEYVPKALERMPILDDYILRVLGHYNLVASMCPEGFSGRAPVSLREISLYLEYYPVDDVYYFIDLMREIDRGIKAHSKNRGLASGSGSPQAVSLSGKAG